MDGPEHKKTSKLPSWVSSHKSPLLFACALIVMFGTGAAVLFVLYRPGASIRYATYKPVKLPPPAPIYYSPLTGIEVPDVATTKRPVTGIMIENSDSARPQSGLKDAGIVYEAIAEGGITRFLALYQEAQPGLIGPVRSVRPYYVEWADPYDASVAHVGGSANALTMIRSGNFGHDLDQFFNGSYYWRANDRYAPHNVYTNFSNLNALEAKKGITTSNFTGFPRVPIPTKQTKPATSKPTPKPPITAANINVHISGADFDSSYVYDQPSNTYARSEGGAPHVDREKGRITPTVVIVMKVAMVLAFEDGYREQITTTGSGAAYIFQDGSVIQGTWSRPDVKSQLVFTGPDGKQINLERGQTWITAIPNGSGSLAWQ